MSVENVDARLVGIICKAHGIKGELIVRLLTDYPKTIYRGSSLFMDEGCTSELHVESIRYSGSGNRKTAIIKFIGTITRTQAESLKGRYLYRKPEDVPPLEKGQYWSDDLEGCMVYSSEGIALGKVIGLENLASNSNIKVKKITSDIDIKGVSGDIFFVPLISDYIKHIDTDEKKIILSRIPEFI
ncbi:MAG: 16S rRNA processing protein RimM [Actinobacteria bacterium]|nr:16S rRNA processing protein RimM [Actinomycetota bacterium]